MEIAPTSPNTPAPSRAAQYVRMLTEHQQYSPENQLDIIRQYAADHNMEIVQVYSDHGRSGLNIAGRTRRNQLYGPGLQRVALSLFKTFHVTERLKFEFRTEAFNVLNTTQFANPNASLSLTPARLLRLATAAIRWPVSVSIFGKVHKANAYNPRMIQFAARLKS